MAIHERDKKIKRVTRVFVYFLIVVVLICLFFIVRRWEIKRNENVKKAMTTQTIIDHKV